MTPIIWRVIETGKASAEAIMAKDERLLKEIGPDHPAMLHFYEWEVPSATYGYFIDPFQFLNRENVTRQGLALARRPTGGGITFHLTDFAFSILIPSSSPYYSLNTLDNYHLINRLVAEAIAPLAGDMGFFSDDATSVNKACRSFCMAKPTQYDLMQGSRKVGGAAQRRTKQGFLHQGTISLALPPSRILEEIILPGNHILEAMHRYTCPLLGTDVSSSQLEEARQMVKALLKKQVALMRVKEARE